ncbi:MAG TPA: TetR/AcrR family transcriptional regulator [Chloroflexota bacterium]
MAISSRAVDTQARKARAERILDVAGALLLRWGYKRVTIEDVAAEAGIGKGTIYLHWTTREALFCAVVERELVAAIEQVLAAIQIDPEAALLHRFVPLWFVTVKSRPLVRAAVTAELDVLGKLVKGVDSEIECRLAATFVEYIGLQREHGALRADVPAAELSYALRAVVRGFFLADVLGSAGGQPPLERRAELLGSILERAFLAPRPIPARVVQHVAPKIVDVFSRVADHFRTELRKAYE